MGISIIELDDLRTQIINLTAICRNKWMAMRLTTNSPKKNRSIDDLGTHMLSSHTLLCARITSTTSFIFWKIRQQFVHIQK